jgi:3-oxoacyl-[acyl-carrier-protein] synthase-3
MSPYSRITGTGSYLPPRRVTNDDLAKELARAASKLPISGSSSAPASMRATFAAPEVTSSDLALEAARHALEAAGRKAARST